MINRFGTCTKTLSVSNTNYVLYYRLNFKNTILHTHTHTHTHTHNIYCTKNNAAVAQLIIQIFTIVLINLFIWLLFSGVNVGRIRTKKEKTSNHPFLFPPFHLCDSLSL